MTASRWTKGPPQRILLATDLSARCDRALDRAASLAQGWHAELVALHVLEQPEEFYATELERRLPSWRRPPDRLHLVEEQLRRDAMEVAGNVTVVLEQGDPAEAILRVAAERDRDSRRKLGAGDDLHDVRGDVARRAARRVELDVHHRFPVQVVDDRRAHAIGDGRDLTERHRGRRAVRSHHHQRKLLEVRRATPRFRRQPRIQVRS